MKNDKIFHLIMHLSLKPAAIALDWIDSMAKEDMSAYKMNIEVLSDQEIKQIILPWRIGFDLYVNFDELTTLLDGMNEALTEAQLMGSYFYVSNI